MAAIRSFIKLTCLFFIGAGIYPDDIQGVVNQFETYAKKAMQEWEIPGMAIAIVKGNQVIYTKGFGVRKLGDTAPVDENTVFQIGSLSKAFTSALVAMMV